MDCIFCKIVAGDVPADKLLENDHVIAFRDLNPQAPHHVLIIPRRHIATVNELSPADAALVGEMSLAAGQVARELGVADDGYRLVLNCNRNGGQTVFHIHMHLLAGRQLGWPPG